MQLSQPRKRFILHVYYIRYVFHARKSLKKLVRASVRKYYITWQPKLSIPNWTPQFLDIGNRQSRIFPKTKNPHSIDDFAWFYILSRYIMFKREFCKSGTVRYSSRTNILSIKETPQHYLSIEIKHLCYWHTQYTF